MSAMYSTGSSRRLWTRPGMIFAFRVLYHDPARRMNDARTAPTMLFVTSKGPMLNSGSALIATWIRLSPASSSGIYLLIEPRATSQIVYIAAPIPSTIPTSVKIGLVPSQLSTSRPPPRPRITEIPSRIPRSNATPQLGCPAAPRRGSSGSVPPSGFIGLLALGVALAHAGADEEPDPHGRDHGSDRQSTQHEKRRGPQRPVQDQPGDRAAHHGDHHDRRHLGQDPDEPHRRQLCHSSSTHSGRTPGVYRGSAERANGASRP